MRFSAVLLVSAVVMWITTGFAELVARVVPRAAEQRIGAALLSELQPQLDGRDISQLQLLADRFAERLPVGSAPRVVVLSDEGINGWALPGDILLLTSGFLDRARSPEEVAFVIGHLLGHCRAREQLSSLGRGLALALAADVVGIGSDQVARLLLEGGLLSRQKFRNRQEIDADRVGAWHLQREYGRPDGALQFFNTLNSVGWPASHFVEAAVSAQARMRAMNTLLREEGWPTTRS